MPNFSTFSTVILSYSIINKNKSRNTSTDEIFEPIKLLTLIGF